MKGNIEKIRADLWLKSALREARDNADKDSKNRIRSRIENLPISQIMDQAQHIENVLLPRIEKKDGPNNEYYLFFAAVFKSLLYAVTIVDRLEYADYRYIQCKIQLEFYREQTERLERELMKYSTLEDLYLSDGLAVMAEGIKKRAIEKLKKYR